MDGDSYNSNIRDQLLGESSTRLLVASNELEVGVSRRLLADVDQDPSVAYQHTVFCQTALPYRDPGDDVREWKRIQGRAVLKVQAVDALDDHGQDVRLGLPYGPKPRLIMSYLNRQALITQSREIEVEDSLTAFVRKLGLDTGGKTLRPIKEQLNRLSAAYFRIAVAKEGGSYNVNAVVLSGIDLWVQHDDRQQVLWPKVVELSRDYLDSLERHAVPLDETALGALSHNAMALDVYAWLAQRLHRVPKGHDQLVTWVNLHDQFGVGYGRLFKFRQVFRRVLRQVLTVYPDARLEDTDRGLVLKNSKPPVAYRRYWPWG